VSPASAWGRLADYLPPGSQPAPRAATAHSYTLTLPGSHGAAGTLWRGDTCLAHTADESILLSVLETDLLILLSETAASRIFIHAGVVTWQGRAIILPGPSGCGKSNLVAALVRAGAQYYSDECAVLDSYGRVYPYARPLTPRTPSGSKTRLGPKLPANPGPVPPGLVAFCRFEAGALWQPRRLTRGQGALGLLERATSARTQPAATVSAVSQVVVQAPVFAGSRDEAASVANHLLDLVTA
jgi:hypothetical protein